MRNTIPFGRKSALVILCSASLLALFMLPAAAYARTGSFPIIGVLHAGGRPEGLAVDEQTHMLYIAYESPGAVVAFDPISGLVRWRTPLSNSVTDIQVDSTSHHVYATAVSYSNNGRNSLFVLDGTTGRVLATLSAGSGDSSVALDDRRHRVYVSSENGTVFGFTFLSGWQSGAIVTQVERLHAGPRPIAVGVNSRLGRLYVADNIEHTITVIDEDSGRILATILVAEWPLAPLRVDETTGRVYVVCSIGMELDVIDGHSNQVIDTIPVAPYPEGIAINTASGRIYVADEGNNELSSSDRGSGTTVTVIDKQSLAVLGTLEVGQAPDGVAADPALRRVYVALEDSSTVVELVDSSDVTLQADEAYQQQIAHQAIALLRQATTVTLMVMALTIVGALCITFLLRRRARENPR